MFASVPMDLVPLFPTGRFGVVRQAVGLLRFVGHCARLGGG